MGSPRANLMGLHMIWLDYVWDGEIIVLWTRY